METLAISNYELQTERKSIFSIVKQKLSFKNYQSEKLHDLNFILSKSTETNKGEYDSLFFEQFRNIKTPVYQWNGNGQNVLCVQGMTKTPSVWFKTARDLQQKGNNVFVIEAPQGIKNGQAIFNPQLYASYIAHFVEKNNIELIITEKEGSYCTGLGLTQDRNTAESVKKIILVSPVKNYLKLMKKYYSHNASSLKIKKILQKNMLKNISNSCCNTYTLNNFKATLNTVQFTEFKSKKSFNLMSI
ncbi:hypothetical protein [Polaribacter sp.]|uniref:hypothetical protein n=1 Tax=Polaribacter sp. TaxID=1920175 RepID=UPI003EF7336C